MVTLFSPVLWSVAITEAVDVLENCSERIRAMLSPTAIMPSVIKCTHIKCNLLSDRQTAELFQYS